MQTKTKGIPRQQIPASFEVNKRFQRLNSIDFLRGLVMIIMALDHTRDFFHNSTSNPLDLSSTTPIFFFTRWITHFCAPVFVFLAGTSIFLQGLRKSKKELSSFLIKRGVWLVLVEIFLMSFAFTFDIHYGAIIFQVIWVTGVSMILLGLLIWLPYEAILVLGLLIVFGHNALDAVEKTHKGNFGFWWDLLHRGNFAFYTIWGNHHLVILYALAPWTGLMLLGYCFGRFYRPEFDPALRKRIFLRLGTTIILFFIALRAFDSYGDPDPWAEQKTGFYTLLSFINVHKYPPSLLYMCMTIGPAIIFLAIFEKTRNIFSRVVTVYGRVPFLYYILHFYMIHLLCMILYLTRGHSFAEGIKGAPGVFFKFVVPGEGYSLAVVYVIWISIVALLYPVCKWFSRYKQTHKKWWVSYL